MLNEHSEAMDILREQAWFCCTECGWTSDYPPEKWEPYQRRVDVDHWIDDDETYPVCDDCGAEARENR